MSSIYKVYHEHLITVEPGVRFLRSLKSAVVGVEAPYASRSLDTVCDDCGVLVVDDVCRCLATADRCFW